MNYFIYTSHLIIIIVAVVIIIIIIITIIIFVSFLNFNEWFSITFDVLSNVYNTCYTSFEQLQKRIW